MKYQEIITQVNESGQDDLILDIQTWSAAGRNVAEIIQLAKSQYGVDLPSSYVHEVLLSADDEDYDDYEDYENETLHEVKMSSSVYDQFLSSGAAAGIQAGFEAELIFSGIGEASYDDEPEPDYSYDTRLSDIDDAVEFFSGGDYGDRHEARRMGDRMREDFWEWQSQGMSEAWMESALDAVKEYIENNDWDLEDEMRQIMEMEMSLSEEEIDEAMEAGASKQGSPERDSQAYTNYLEARDAADNALNERAQESIDSQDSSYESAREEWEDEHRDDYDESEWLREQGIRRMSDVESNYTINWPHYTNPESSEGGYTLSAAEKLAADLSDDLDVRTIASSGYHQVVRKPGLWIIEPDGSLTPDDSDDMPAEIVSPPMPIDECLETLTRFYRWAKSQGAYSNDSTGFHVGVSLPDVGGEVDHVKLALFLGDQYVLDSFARSANTYATSAIKKIKDSVEAGQISEEQVKTTLDQMKSAMITMASQTLGVAGGQGKFTSVNMKGKYVEFRSMGNEHYFTSEGSLAKVTDMIKRYAYAMYIASRPDLYRAEYAKKLYKMLDRSGNASAAMADFANYVSAVGGADQTTVRNFLSNMRSSRSQAASASSPLPDRRLPATQGRVPQPMVRWRVQDNMRTIDVEARNEREALSAAADRLGVPVASMRGFDVRRRGL